jgi:23S rRNA pseudouridine2605 synthase
MVYVLLNKPKGFIATTADDKERKTVMELVESACEERIYPVGRLDRATAWSLAIHQRWKTGRKADPSLQPHPQDLSCVPQQTDEGRGFGDHCQRHQLEDGFIKPDRINYVVEAVNGDELGIQIHSGKNHIVRRIFEHMGYDVVKLDRTLFAGLTKKDLPRGKWRFLTEKEVAMLKMLAKVVVSKSGFQVISGRSSQIRGEMRYP